MSENTVSKGFFWKLLERFGVSGTQFILQIILARILAPEHYGVLSLMLVFVNLANVFIQNGLNTALVQDKDVTDEDYSSVFWITLIVSGILYTIIFLTAPLIASFYEMPDIIAPLRIIALILLPGAYNSIQLAKVSRSLDFKKVFIGNVGAVLISGIAGIVIARNGGGLWALVAQSLISTVVACLIMSLSVRWYPRLILNWRRVRVLFNFGWKLVVSGLIETLYQDLNSLVIGKKYDSEALAYNNRGKQFPHFIISAVSGAAQSVMLPAMSAEQDDKSKVKELARSSIMLSCYIIFPIMAGLAAVATPLVSLILTDIWLPCVPFLQIYCISQAFYPVHSCNLQAINAIGRSDMFLKLELIKKSYGIVALIIAVLCFNSPIAIAMTSIITTVVGCFVNAYPNKKLIGYSYFEQMKDILPSIIISVIMCVSVLLVGMLALNNFVLLVLQIFVGICVYFLLSVIFKPAPYKMLINYIKNFKNKKSDNNAQKGTK